MLYSQLEQPIAKSSPENISLLQNGRGFKGYGPLKPPPQSVVAGAAPANKFFILGITV